MKSTYAQTSSTLQKAATPNAASVLDSSPQSESLQRKADMTNAAAQREEAPRPNNTGMPDNLKAGIESLSGFSMDNVRVHYNSSKPATVQALAYTQGTDIHVAPGQEKCLPHEAWHVAQQMAGRVSPTTNINGMPVNDNAALEHEADVMGEKAVQCKFFCCNSVNSRSVLATIQRMSVAKDDGKGGLSMENTDQYDSAEIPFMTEGEKKVLGEGKCIQRSDELAKLVDLYKKEMLTRIAFIIEKKGRESGKSFAPHVSVAITGGFWYVAINSKQFNDLVKGGPEKDVDRKAVLRPCIKYAQEKIQSEFLMLCEKQTEKRDQIVKCDQTENRDSYEKRLNEQKALFIAFRWASKEKEPVITNSYKTPDSGCKHGEMETIDYLNENGVSWPEKSIVPFVRVVRIGGTRTPCFDCAEEMNPCGRADTDLHRHTRNSVNKRHVLTMTSLYGPQFVGWCCFDSINPTTGLPTSRGRKSNQEGADYYQEQNFFSLYEPFVEICKPQNGNDYSKAKNLFIAFDCILHTMTNLFDFCGSKATNIDVVNTVKEHVCILYNLLETLGTLEEKGELEMLGWSDTFDKVKTLKELFELNNSEKTDLEKSPSVEGERESEESSSPATKKRKWSILNVQSTLRMP